MKTPLKKQQCNVAGLAIGWIAYAASTAYVAYRYPWAAALLWIAGVPSLRWALYYFFPRISHYLGYGRIADRFSSGPPSHANSLAAPVELNLYTFFSCPFCPIVFARLQALQHEMGFALTIIDVTLKPQTLMAKGIRSVPVVEVGDHRLTGNSTTEQLEALITCRRTPELSRAS